MRPQSKVFALAVMLSATPVWAASAPEVAPVEITGTIHASAPYGSGRMSFLLLTVYTATLWTDAPSWSMDAPFALTLTYAMSFDGIDIVQRSDEQMRIVDPALSDAEMKTYDAAMTAVFPAVAKGDEITALYVPGQPVRVFKNGMPTGTLPSGKFAADFFGIWLSPKTSESSLRKALLKLP